MFIASSAQLQPTFRALYNQAKVMLDNGKSVDVEVKEHKHRRSSEQNNYYWLFNGQLSDFLNDAGLSYGEFKLPYTSEIIHDINKKLFGVKTTTKLSIGEFCEYMNKLLIFWNERTKGEFQISELPETYLTMKGYIIK